MELKEYVFNEIVPRYSGFDSAHREDHALTVISQVMQLADARDAWLADNPDKAEGYDSPLDRDMLLVAAACHDLGLANGRDRHHMDSGVIIRSDGRLRNWFSEDQIETIAQAAEDHRASGKSVPRSLYGMMVAEADRVIDKETIIYRTVLYGLNNYPELGFDAQLSRAKAHLHEKYGRGGYLKLWIPWGDNAMRLAELQELIGDESALHKEVRRILIRELDPKRIYFAGSIRGGRVDAGLYARLIAYMQRTAVVLTEHVGRPDLNLMEQGKRDADIYSQDTSWLLESDMVVAECTCPSLGVGYELAFAEAHGKPCHIFYDRSKTQLSAMLTGNPYFHIHPYESESDIYPLIDMILKQD